MFRFGKQWIFQARLLALLFTLAVPSMSASTLFFSGNLRTNANVIDCGLSCTLAPGDSDADWAQWAARVETFTVSTPSTMEAITFSYGGGTSATGPVVSAGGSSPYLSLFDGSGNFLASTYFGTYCPPGANTDLGRGQCYDVSLNGGLLAPGNYSIAFSVFANMSYAENLGTPYLLSDGFTGLGNLDGTLDYAFDVNLSPTTAPVPEPSSLLFLGTGLAGLAGMIRRRLNP